MMLQGLPTWGIEMLGASVWSDSVYAVCLELHSLSAESHRSAAHMEKAKQRVKEIQDHARDTKDHFRAYNVLVDTLYAEKSFAKAIKEALSGEHALSFGPRNPRMLDAMFSIFKVHSLLKGRTPQDLRSLAMVQDRSEEVNQAINLLFVSLISAWHLSDLPTLISGTFKPFALTLNSSNVCSSLLNVPFNLSVSRPI